jgi:NitT/TauT family transport system substrate-binding protein
MRRRYIEGWSRREFLGLTVAGTAGLLGLKPEPVAAGPPPETTTVRLTQISALCWAPQYVAEELLQDEGFTEVQYIKKEGNVGVEKALASGEVDISTNYAASIVIRLDVGDPVVVLAGGMSAAWSCLGPSGCRRSAT